jgi:hypothetical protein
MSTTNVNGRGRPSLAEQIERLDGILDGLVDGLNEAVADAVRQAVAVAVQEAVRLALREALASPDLRARLLPPPLPPFAAPLPEPAREPVPEATQTGSTWRRLGRGLVRAWGGLRELARRAGAAVRTLLSRGWGKVAGWIAVAYCGVRTLGRRAWQWRREIGLSSSAGVVAGLGSYLTGPIVAAVSCGLTVATLTATWVWLAPVLCNLPHAEAT